MFLYIQLAGDETTDELDLEELESAPSQDDLTPPSMADFVPLHDHIFPGIPR